MVYLIAPGLSLLAFVIGWTPRHLTRRGLFWLAGIWLLLAVGEYLGGYFPAINARFWLWLLLFLTSLLVARFLQHQTLRVWQEHRRTLTTLLGLLVAAVGLPVVGALLPLLAILVFLWARSRRRRRAFAGPDGGTLGDSLLHRVFPGVPDRLAPLALLLLTAMVALLFATMAEPPLITTAAWISYGEQAGLVHARKTLQLPAIRASDVPVVGRSSALAAFQNAVGSLGPQYHVSQTGMSLVRYQGQLVWTAPLDFNSFWIWLVRQSSPGYLVMPAGNPSARPQLVLRQHYVFTPRAGLWHNVNRLLYQHFPTLIIGRTDWELSPSGQGRWVTSLYAPAPGLDSIVTRVLVGCAITDPTTGVVRFEPLGRQPAWVSQIVGPGFAQSEAARYGWDRAGFLAANFAHDQTTQPVHRVPYNVLLGKGALGWAIPMTSPSRSDNSLSGLMLVNAETNQVLYTPFTGVQNDRAITKRIGGATVNSSLAAGRPLLYNLDGHLAYVAPVENPSHLIEEVAIVDPTNLSPPLLAQDLPAADLEWQNYLASSGGGRSSLLRSFQGRVERVSTFLQAGGNGGSAFSEEWLFLIGGRAYGATAMVNPSVVPFVQAGDFVRGRYLNTGSPPYPIRSLTDVTLTPGKG